MRTVTKSSLGFSLIEMVIVLAIFFVVISVAVDIFLSVVQQQRRIVQEQELLNQSSYLEEYLSKALLSAVKAPTSSCIATGTVYQLTHCLNGTLQACNGVKFINAIDGNACEEFELDETFSNPPFRQNKNGLGQNLLADKYKVKFARFIIDGDKTIHAVTSADATQPRLTILLDVQTQGAPNQEKITQQTISPSSLIR